jgi:hypothetical protein
LKKTRQKKLIEKKNKIRPSMSEWQRLHYKSSTTFFWGRTAPSDK